MFVLRVYLCLVLRCRNLDVEICVFVIKLIFDENNSKKVIGVIFKKNGKEYIVYVNEVILFGGVFNIL